MFDTSALLALQRNYARPVSIRAFAELRIRVNRGILVYPKEVIAELERREDATSAWASHNGKKATRYNATDQDALHHALRQVLEHPHARNVFDPDAEAADEVADPYVLALGLHLRARGFEPIVVQQEKQKHDRPGRISLSTACGHLRLHDFPLEAYLREQEIQVE